jgi:hypothetical protein
MMAISQAIRSRSSAQSRAPQPASPKASKFASASTPKLHKKRRPRRLRNLPLLPSTVVTRQGKTSIRRFANGAFCRMQDVKGEIVDFVELFTSREYHCMPIPFQDRTRHHGVHGVKQHLLCIQ